jgi:hypothetical protein
MSVVYMTRNKNLQLIQNPYTCVQGRLGCRQSSTTSNSASICSTDMSAFASSAMHCALLTTFLEGVPLELKEK